MADIDLDEEAERAFQAALLAQGLTADDGAEGEDDEEAERAWQAAQMEAMKSSGGDDDDADRAWEAARQQAQQEQTTSTTPTTNSQLTQNWPAHWEGFITQIEKVWDITFRDIKFGEQIGVGAFGSVHKGQYFGTDVAIKTVFTEGDETNMMYLQREINVLKGCRHPNIVAFIGISNDTTNSLLHIVTEYISDGDLRAKLKDPKVKIPWDIRARVAHDLASAMAYLHSRGIVHRDIKSKNLLVDYNWRIKLCDFGFSRTCEQKKRPMTICGTEAWMAPEIILGQAYGASSDVFSYGIVLCELISRGKVSNTLARKAEDGFAFSREKFELIVSNDTPEDFKSAVLEATMYDPDSRPSFADLAEHFEILTKDLEALVAEEKKNTPRSALEKFRSKAAALTVPLIEKGTIRERRNGLQRLAGEQQQEAVVVKAVPLREQKSTRRVQVPNQKVSTVHALIGGQIAQSINRNAGGKTLPPLVGTTPTRPPATGATRPTQPAVTKPPPGGASPAVKPTVTVTKPSPGAGLSPAGARPSSGKPKPAPGTGTLPKGTQLPGLGQPASPGRGAPTTSNTRPLPTPPPNNGSTKT